MTAQEGSAIRITHFDETGLLQFTNNLVSSNKSYRVEYASALPGPWHADTNILLFATNSLLSATLALPQTAPQQFIRVARNYFVASLINQSNILAVAAHEDGERLTIFTNLAVVYTRPTGETASLYVSTNGLPDTVVDGQYVLLFRNYTSNSVDIGIVWPGGSNSVVRAVPLDASALVRLQQLHSVIAPPDATSQQARPKDVDPVQFLHDVTEFGLLEVSLASCAVAVAATASTIVFAPVLAAACGGAFVDSYALISGNEVANTTSTAFGSFLCATAFLGYDLGDAADCLATAMSVVNDALLGALHTLDAELSAVSNAEMALEPPPAEMVLIPAGSFTMGNCMSPSEGDSGELPTRAVYVSAFYMDKYLGAQGPLGRGLPVGDQPRLQF